MKKIVFLTPVLMIVLSIGSLSFAEEMKGMDGKDSMMKKGMMGKDMMGHMMMKSMMDKSVVPTSDGGIVIVAGNKITKYDKDLNVVKEADVKVDMEAMKKQMGDMMKMCPMMGDMKDMSGESKGTGETPATESAGAEENAADHASHH